MCWQNTQKKNAWKLQQRVTRSKGKGAKLLALPFQVERKRKQIFLLTLCIYAASYNDDSQSATLCATLAYQRGDN